MFCHKCGAQVDDQAAFCDKCGTALQNTLPRVAAVPTPAPAPGYAAPAPAFPAAVQYAGFWRRFGAAVLDWLIMSAVNTVIQMISTAIGIIKFDFESTSDSAQLNFTPGMWGVSAFGFIIMILYFALMESSSKQGTLGKMVLGIVVTDGEGKRISFGRALGRNLAKIISDIILFIGHLMVAFTPRKQGLHDMIAGTLVVVKK
jgi:uncharacterized RDD family membrane protein YckC